MVKKRRSRQRRPPSRRMLPDPEKNRIVLGLTLFCLAVFIFFVQTPSPSLTGYAIASSAVNPLFEAEKVNLCNTERPFQDIFGKTREVNVRGERVLRGAKTAVLDSTLCDVRTTLFSILKRCQPATSESFVRADYYCGEQGACAFVELKDEDNNGLVLCAYITLS